MAHKVRGNSMSATLPVGIHDGVGLSDYLLMPALSSGILHTLITRTAAHAAYEQSVSGDATKASDLGSAAHAILLEGSEACIVVCDFADWRKDEAKAKRDDARAAGKIPLLTAQMGEIRRMVDVARAYIEESPLAQEWAGSMSERTAKWQENGLICKARFDRVSVKNDLIFDYKTCGGSVNPRDWNRHVIVNGYDIQAAFYQRGYKAIHGREARFVWLAQETEPPYICCFMDMAPDFQAFADSRVSRGIGKWGQAIQTGKWSAYPKRVCSLDVPQWALSQEETESVLSAFSPEELEGGIPL